MRPVPAARSYGPHPLTIKQKLEALGYTVGPSAFSYRRRVARDGVVRHLTVEEACDLLPKAPPPAVSQDELLRDMAARIRAQVA